MLFGIGLGGFVDGIVFHQILQWHHLLTCTYPTSSLRNLRINTLADGLFHAGTWVVVAVALLQLWRQAQCGRLVWPGRLLAGTLLLGFGGFNLVEGLVDHQWLGLHHVNETVPRDDWWVWDLGFLAWGAAMAGVGAWLVRRPRRGGGTSVAAPSRPLPNRRFSMSNNQKKTVWIVVADEAIARIVSWHEQKAQLDNVEELTDPNAHASGSDMRHDAQGRRNDTVTSSASDTQSHQAAGLFAKRVAARLDEALQQKRYDELRLIAVPRFLGLLRKAVSANVERHITDSLDKDLIHMTNDDIATRLVARAAAAKEPDPS